MIAFAQPTAAPEIGTPTTRTVLLEDAIDPSLQQFGQQEKGSEERIAHQHTEKRGQVHLRSFEKLKTRNRVHFRAAALARNPSSK